MITLKQVNKALAEAGHPERLVKSGCYFYFVDGLAHTWYSSSVYVNRLNALTLPQWIDERNTLAYDQGEPQRTIK